MLAWLPHAGQRFAPLWTSVQWLRFQSAGFPTLHLHWRRYVLPRCALPCYLTFQRVGATCAPPRVKLHAGTLGPGQLPWSRKNQAAEGEPASQSRLQLVNAKQQCTCLLFNTVTRITGSRALEGCSLVTYAALRNNDLHRLATVLNKSAGARCEWCIESLLKENSRNRKTRLCGRASRHTFTNRYAPTSLSNAGLLRIISVDPFSTAICFLRKSAKVRVTVSREVPMICAISS